MPGILGRTSGSGWARALVLYSAMAVPTLVGAATMARETGTPLPPLDAVPMMPLAAEDITARAPAHAETQAPMGPPHGPPEGVKSPSWREVRVIDLSRTPRAEASQIPLVFFWPDGKTLGKAGSAGAVLQAAEEKWDSGFATWASSILSFGAARPARLKVYRASRAESYYLPKGEQTVVRFVSDLLDKTRRRPAQVQIVADKPYPQGSLRGLLRALPEWEGEGRIVASNLPLLVDIVAAAPLSERLRNAAWRLRSFGYDRDYRVVKVTLTAENHGVPLRLQVAIGPRGSLLVLSGAGLDRLPEGKGAISKNRPPTVPGAPVVPGQKP